MKSISKMNIFAHLKVDVLISIISRSIMNKYQSYTVIFKEKEKPACVWIVLSGKLKIVMFIDINGKETLVGVEDMPENSVIGAFNYFNKELPYAIGCVAECPSHVIAIPFEVIEKYGDLLMKDTLKELSKEYPDPEEIRKMYIQVLQWNSFKKDLFQEKLFESRQMKKVREQMRVPLPKMNYLPKDIVKYITEEPKGLFFKKKKVDIVEGSSSTNQLSKDDCHSIARGLIDIRVVKDEEDDENEKEKKKRSQSYHKKLVIESNPKINKNMLYVGSSNQKSSPLNKNKPDKNPPLDPNFFTRPNDSGSIQFSLKSELNISSPGPSEKEISSKHIRSEYDFYRFKSLPRRVRTRTNSIISSISSETKD